MTRMLALPEVRSRLGNVKFCQKALTPVLAAKKEEPKKEEKKAVVAPPKEKSDVDPLDVLPPSKFDLNAFKDFFVNCKDKRGEGMKYFFDNYDKEGYSIYFLHYEKYEGEGTIMYQFANLRNGFL